MQSTAELSTVLQFTADDLEQNRQGRLSAAQIERLQVQVRKNQQGCLFFTAFAAVFGAVIGFAGARSVLAGLGVAGAVVILCLLALVAFANRSQRNLKLGTAQTVRGAATLYSTPPTKGGSRSYYVRIERERFDVPLSVYRSFQEGRSYAVYFTVLFSNTMLSAEALN